MDVRTWGCAARVGVALAMLLTGRTAYAQGVGFQGGVSVDPEQAYGGVHFESKALVDRLHLRPGIEGGVGDDVTLAAINVDFIYRFELQGSRWSVYQGGGPAVNIYRIADNNEIQGGLNVIFGFAHEGGFFAEFKVGSSGSPNLKFGIGYTVR